MSAPTEQQVAGRTSDTVNTAKTKKNTRKNGKFKRNQVKIFLAGLPPRTPVRTHTPVSRYGPSPPRARGPVPSGSVDLYLTGVCVRTGVRGGSPARKF